MTTFPRQNRGPVWRTLAIGKTGISRRGIGDLFAACAATVSLCGNAQACRLALVLAIDVSISVDAEEDMLQRQGLARALLSPAVQDAFFASPDPVALMVFEWSGRYDQTVITDWVEITTPDSLTRVANDISTSRRVEKEAPTSMGYALGFAATKLREVPHCANRTIDMAGDGVNNHGFGPAQAYAAFPFDRVTVNGLVILPTDPSERRDLMRYYQTDVIRGPGAFVEIADGFHDFEAAMQRKLLREVRPQMLGQKSDSTTPFKG